MGFINIRIRLIALLLISYSVLYAQPNSVRSASPIIGPPGTIVTLTGSFQNQVDSIKIGNENSIIVSQSSTEIKLFIPSTATTGNISLFTAGIPLNTGIIFNVTSPTIPRQQINSKISYDQNTNFTLQGYSFAISDDCKTFASISTSSGVGDLVIYKQLNCQWVIDTVINTGIVTRLNSVAISSDGRTIALGASNQIGGATGVLWVYRKLLNTWTLEASRLIGTGRVGAANPSADRVSISADGNTIVYGDTGDDFSGQGSIGAVWVFKRNGSSWVQDGQKIVGTGYVKGTFGCHFGSEVSISEDGTTIAASASEDNNNKGATWVFKKVGSTWQQQGNKLIGTGGDLSDRQGYSIDLNDNGSVLVVGGPLSGSGASGKVWVFRNINGPWGQDGNYLVRQNDRFGKSVSIDATGTIACIGGDWFNNNAGSTWVYKWNNGVWAYTNVVLFGSGAVGPARQGEFVKMTNNAKYLFVGGPADNSSKGAIWHFADTSCTPRLIQQADTLVCKSSNITLSIDPSVYNSSACTNAQLNTGVRNGLVGYWPFCGNANDESGNANNGTVFGATLTSDRFGRPNSAYSFNGQNANYIKSPGSTLFTSNNMTLSYWVNITTYNELSEIICLGNSSGTYWGASASNRIVALNYGSGCGTGMTTYPTYTFTPNSWFNVTIVADRINRINKIYINGQFIGNNPSGTLSGCSTADLYFGVDIFGLPEYFTGKLDDICIWNRALTTAEIQQISNNNLQNISVLWSTGSSANSINVSPQQTTTYYVTVNIGGATYTDSIRVQVSTVDTSVVNLDPTSICLTGGQVRLQAGLASSYLWLRENMPIPGATNQLYTALQTGSYRVVMSNSLGCIDTSRAILVTVNPQPIPSFTVNRSSQCKNGNSFIFTNNSTISSGTLSYAWSFGDGNTSTALSPTYSYTAAGTYAVKLVVTSNNGCRDSITQTVSVLPSPMPGFTVNNLTQCLSGNSFVFTNTSTITPGTLSYSWNFGNGTTSTATNPTFSYAAAGTYTVTLIATSNSGCIDSIRQNVVVNSNASGSISTPTSTIICEGGSVTLSANGGTTYQWALNGANIPGATNPTYSASLPGVYSVQINNASGCSGTSSNTITLSLVRRPTADFTSTGSCASFPVTFTNQSTVSNSGIVTYSWTFGNGSTSTNVNPTAVYSSPGNYNVTLIVTPQACPALSSSITKPITVINATPNQRYTSLNAVVNRNLQLQARTFTGAIYQWIPPTGLNNATIVNPIFNSNRQQEYLIKIATPDGCVVTDTLLVRIFDGRGIYLPKGFTPNGDGNNDKLTPRLVGISRLIFFKVYDRWGQLMYQTSIAGEGWDGTFKGVKQPIETYTWVAEGVDIDGNTIRETGNSMLLR